MSTQQGIAAHDGHACWIECAIWRRLVNCQRLHIMVTNNASHCASAWRSDGYAHQQSQPSEQSVQNAICECCMPPKLQNGILISSLCKCAPFKNWHASSMGSGHLSNHLLEESQQKSFAGSRWVACVLDRMWLTCCLLAAHLFGPCQSQRLRVCQTLADRLVGR